MKKPIFHAILLVALLSSCEQIYLNANFDNHPLNQEPNTDIDGDPVGDQIIWSNAEVEVVNSYFGDQNASRALKFEFQYVPTTTQYVDFIKGGDPFDPLDPPLVKVSMKVKKDGIIQSPKQKVLVQLLTASDQLISHLEINNEDILLRGRDIGDKQGAVTEKIEFLVDHKNQRLHAIVDDHANLSGFITQSDNDPILLHKIRFMYRAVSGDTSVVYNNGTTIIDDVRIEATE